MRCNCSKGVVCKCAIYEDDLTWAKALGLVGVVLVVVLLGVPRAYQWFKGPDVVVAQTHAAPSHVLSSGETMRLSKLRSTPLIPL